MNLFSQEFIAKRTEELRAAEATLRADWWAAHQETERLLKELNDAIRERVDWERRAEQEAQRVKRLKDKG
jgi:hypothetical protein